MNQWGVRHVDIEILRWGDVQRSLVILRPRTKYAHVRRMVDQIEDRYAELARPLETAAHLAATPEFVPSLSEVIAADAPSVPAQSAAARATAVSGTAGVRMASGGFTPSQPAGAPLKRFHTTP
jgi:hypothetical protein